MFCTNCGRPLNDGEKFCPSCGTVVANPASVPQEAPADNPTPTPQPDIYASPEPAFTNYAPSATPTVNYQIATLILGILSVCFSILNYLGIYYVHLVGLALGIIAVSLAGKAKRTPGGTYSKAGNVLGILGIILGGIATIVGIISVF